MSRISYRQYAGLVLVVFLVVLVVVLLAPNGAIRRRASGRTDSIETSGPPPCRPVDSAWAIEAHVTDAVSGRPVGDARAEDEAMDGADTDSSGWACLRNLVNAEHTLRVSRPGYREYAMTLKGTRGQVVHHEVRYERVAPPCCDLRGRWRITFRLEEPNRFYPKPDARSVSGEVALGPRHLPAEAGDDVDSLVRVVRGLHHVNFTPFFGGPVARDVSTSVFGGGPDLVHEVEATVPAADTVEITFIPRMSHGSLSLSGRIREDTIKGRWVQNAYCCGARGRFVMTRIGSVDTSTVPDSSHSNNGGRGRMRMMHIPPLTSPPGTIPAHRWRPELGIAPGGRLWLAIGGLFVADSLTGEWHRVLGGGADPVEADELRIGLQMAFVGSRGAIIGMDSRFPVTAAPVIYRTTDGGQSWTSVVLHDVSDVSAAGAVGLSVWLTTRTSDGSAGLAQSRDGGETWAVTRLPPAVGHVWRMYRASETTAFLATSTDSTDRTFWRTTDGGSHWSPIPTPHEQGLQRLGASDSRVEQIAVAGSWLLVNEHGKVFASPATDIHWKLLPGLHDVASSPGVDTVFVLMNALEPALLDKDLHTVWRSSQSLPIKDPGEVEQVVFREGIGYVSEGDGSVHEIRNGRLRVVRPPPSRPDTARMILSH